MKTLLLTLITSVFLTHLAQAACNIPVRTKSYEKYQNGVYFDMISVPKTNIAELSSSNQFNYLSFLQKKISAKTSSDFLYLTKRHHHFIDKNSSEVLTQNLALEKKIGRKRQGSCLENFLLDNHLRTFSNETPFVAFVLTHVQYDQAMVFVSTGSPSPKINESVLMNLTQQYISQGWNFDNTIHYVPFNLKNINSEIGGVIAPTTADAINLKNLGDTHKLRSLTLYNAFESFVLYKTELSKPDLSAIINK